MITKLAAALAAGTTSSVAAVQECLAVINERDASLHAMSQVLADSALAEATARDATRASDVPVGPLHGVPMVIKEEIDVAGCVTTFGGLANSTPAEADSEVVRRLRAAGAVIVGKTQMPEFGSFPYTEPEAFASTQNPWKLGMSPGGSSGGTAVAVATGMAVAGLGGDGGGSIRIPSACTGLFGLKPTRGRVTSAPSPHLWFGLGTCGPLTRSVMDSAIVYDAIKGSSPGDLFSAPDPGSFVEAAARAPGGLRIGWSVKSPSLGVSACPEHVEAVQAAARLLADLGHDVVEIDPAYPDSTAQFVPQFFASIRFEADRMEHFERLEKRTMQTYSLGRWVTPKVLDWALEAAEKFSSKVNRVFDQCDVLLTPVMAHRPPKIGIITGKGTLTSALKSMPAIAYMSLWNVAGNPAASVPFGMASDGLPLAVQLVGRLNDEPTLLSVAGQIEQAQPFPSLIA